MVNLYRLKKLYLELAEERREIIYRAWELRDEGQLTKGDLRRMTNRERRIKKWLKKTYPALVRGGDCCSRCGIMSLRVAPGVAVWCSNPDCDYEERIREY